MPGEKGRLAGNVGIHNSTMPDFLTSISLKACMTRFCSERFFAIDMLPSDLILYDTANPAASSAGKLILLPEESLSQLGFRKLFGRLRLYATGAAPALLLILIGIFTSKRRIKLVLLS